MPMQVYRIKFSVEVESLFDINLCLNYTNSVHDYDCSVVQKMILHDTKE